MTKTIKVLLIILMGMVASVNASAQYESFPRNIQFYGGANSFIPIGETNSIVSAPAGGGVFGVGKLLAGVRDGHVQELTLNYAFALSGKRKVGETPNSYTLHSAFLGWRYYPTRNSIYIGGNVGWGQTIISTYGTPSSSMKRNYLYWAPKIGVTLGGMMDIGVRYDFLGGNKGLGVDILFRLGLFW